MGRTSLTRTSACPSRRSNSSSCAAKADGSVMSSLPPYQRQAVQAQGPSAMGPYHHAVIDAIVRNMAVKFLQGHAQLQAGQVRAQAAVRSRPEGHVAVRGSTEVDR